MLASTVAQSQPLSPSSDRHQALVPAMGTYLAKDMHPLTTVEGIGFLHLMEVAEPRFIVPRKKHFSKTVIPAMYSQEKEKVQRSLDEDEVAEELLAILKPFNDTTEVVGGERYPTLSIVLPILHKLLHVTLKATNDDTHLAKEIKRVIRADLELRYQDKETETLSRIATYLDPRFKSLSFLDEVAREGWM